jgi:hypothetical protein
MSRVAAMFPGNATSPSPIATIGKTLPYTLLKIGAVWIRISRDRTCILDPVNLYKRLQVQTRFVTIVKGNNLDTRV